MGKRVFYESEWEVGDIDPRDKSKYVKSYTMNKPLGN